ncbi:UPF0598 protein C8orf82 homolog, partial [Passer montanus]|uniref:UPF0598 protein C8orf82 homolog n=1 Tax=Passer montanus TaxID=9160 RepID=UPI0019611259
TRRSSRSPPGACSGTAAGAPRRSSHAAFLSFSFRRLQRNRSGRYEAQFPPPKIAPKTTKNHQKHPPFPADVAFLSFFFRRLQRNRSGRYEAQFPFVSRCGRERNFLRCSDLAVVFTAILPGGGECRLSYCGGGAELTVPFRPGALAVLPENGRLYHPAPERVGGVGLVRSALAQELSSGFRFEDGPQKPPTHFWWEGTEYRLSGEILGILRAEKSGLEVGAAISTS